MANREENRRDNDSLQSGPDDAAFGQDARDFGAGGQTVTDTQGEGSPADRETGQDSTFDIKEGASGDQGSGED